jgi:hypothetical protein
MSLHTRNWVATAKTIHNLGALAERSARIPRHSDNKKGGQKHLADAEAETVRRARMPDKPCRFRRILRPKRQLLAGTELPLILTDLTEASIPLLDTTDIHVNAAVKLAWA